MPKRVIVLRSCRLYDFIPCCHFIRDEFDPDEWITIVQEGTELPDDLFPSEKWKRVDYPPGFFTKKGLKQLRLHPFSREDIVVIPFNNPEGKGYSRIIRFFGWKPELYIWYPDHILRKATFLKRFFFMYSFLMLPLIALVAIFLFLIFLFIVIPIYAVKWVYYKIRTLSRKEPDFYEIT